MDINATATNNVNPINVLVAHCSESLEEKIVWMTQACWPLELKAPQKTSAPFKPITLSPSLVCYALEVTGYTSLNLSYVALDTFCTEYCYQEL
eukprot:superscaffoldBa00003557_g17212